MIEKLEIVILGGGTAGWMSAAALVSLVGEKLCTITLVESEEIASVGVGEATLPHIKEFNERIGLNEAEVMKYTQATVKLGIEFSGWGKPDSAYIHPFGTFGEAISGADFHQQWARLNQLGRIKDIGSYSYSVQSCRANKFQFPDTDPQKISSTFSYAYHLDASRYAEFLRNFCLAKGVDRIEGKVDQIVSNSVDGHISSLVLESGLSVKGDFFIDCSGFKSLLLGQHLQSEFEDWSDWLVCDSAWAVASEPATVMHPYTRAIARRAGWQWQIPLQGRTGNGYVFSSQYVSADEAINSLLANLPGAATSEPRQLKFKAGRYKKAWDKNCLAIGLASGFLEPLESTSIYLIQKAVTHFIDLLPEKRPDLALAQEFNRLMDFEYERIRDFLILHYHLNQRDDGELWHYCRSMSIPQSLDEKIALFKHRGYVDSYKFGLFSLASWVAVFNGQNLIQQGFDPLATRVADAKVSERMLTLAASIEQTLMPVQLHKDFLENYCPARWLGGNRE